MEAPAFSCSLSSSWVNTIKLGEEIKRPHLYRNIPPQADCQSGDSIKAFFHGTEVDQGRSPLTPALPFPVLEIVQKQNFIVKKKGDFYLQIGKTTLLS